MSADSYFLSRVVPILSVTQAGRGRWRGVEGLGREAVAAALTVVGSLVFSGTHPADMVALTARPLRFQSVIYTLDVLLPIGGLGQKSAWQPTTSGLLLPPVRVTHRPGSCHHRPAAVVPPDLSRVREAIGAAAG